MSTKKPTAAESAKMVRAIAENASVQSFHGNGERYWCVSADELPEGDVDEALHAAAKALDLLAEIAKDGGTYMRPALAARLLALVEGR